MLEWNKGNAIVPFLGETVVVERERSPAWFVVSLALWGLAGYGAYKLITR